MRTARPCAGLLLAVALAPLLAHADEQQKEQQLINLSQSNPMVVEDALPQNPGVQGGFSATNVERQGENGLWLEGQVQYGTPFGLELGTSWQTGVAGGEYQPGQVRGWALGRLTKEQHGALPQLALKGQVLSPDPDNGVAGQLGLLATENVGLARVHLNASYRLVHLGADHVIVGVGTDRQVGERVLVVGDVYYDAAYGKDPNARGIEAGANVVFGDKTALQGVIGLNDAGGDVDPLLLISLTRQL